MITHAEHLAARPPIFVAPFGALLAGLVGDVPRYQREKSVVFSVRSSSSSASVMSVAALALQSRIIDVLKQSALVLEEIPERRVMDATSIAAAIDSKRSTTYKMLYLMLDEGKVVKVIKHRLCVEWAMP